MSVDYKGFTIYLFIHLFTYLIALTCIPWPSHEIWSFNVDIKKKGCLCELTEPQAPRCCHPPWRRQVGGWVHKVALLRRHFSWFSPNWCLGKKLRSSFKSRTWEVATSHCGLFPSDICYTQESVIHPKCPHWWYSVQGLNVSFRTPQLSRLQKVSKTLLRFDLSLLPSKKIFRVFQELPQSMHLTPLVLRSLVR